MTKTESCTNCGPEHLVKKAEEKIRLEVLHKFEKTGEVQPNYTFCIRCGLPVLETAKSCTCCGNCMTCS